MAVSVPYSHFAPNLADARDNTLTIRTVNYKIVHQVDGRMRVQVPRLIHDAKFADRLAGSVSALPTVKTARINRDTASLVVTYRQGPGRNGHGPSGREAVLSGVIGCIRTAAKADVARNVASGVPAPAAQAQVVDLPYLFKQLTVPALGLGLSAALSAGVALPPALVGGTVAAATIPHVLRGIQGLRTEKRLTVETLDVTAVALLLAQSSFLAPAFMMAVIESAEVVRTLTARRGHRAGLDVLLPEAHQVLVERGGRQDRVKAAGLVPGDIIRLNAWDRIPADGEVLEGNARIDEHQVTGSPLPVAVEHGDVVLAATVVVEGQLRVRVVQTGKDTHAGSVLASRDAAPQVDTRVSNYSRKTGNWAVVPTLAIGGAIWATSGSMARATGIVALDFGLGMRVSTPIAVLAAQARGARHGVSIRSGRALEVLAQVDTVVFGQATSCGEESAATVAALRQRGKAVYIAGSESNPSIAAAAAALGVDPANAYGGLSPLQKMDLVGALQAGGKRVAFLGGCTGDTAAMAHADLAISYGSADPVAKDTADVVLEWDDPAGLLVGMRIAGDLMRTIRQNQAIVVGTNSAGIAYGALAVLNPIAGVLINNGVAVVAAINSLRALILPAGPVGPRAKARTSCPLEAVQQPGVEFTTG